MIQEELFDGYSIRCDIIPMGKDCTLAVYGGDTPHVGSVVMAAARPSLTGDGISTTSSVINCPGHKDEVIARLFAEEAAKTNRCTVVCTCGIHVDRLTPEQLALVQTAARRLLGKVLESIKSKNGINGCTDGFAAGAGYVVAYHQNKRRRSHAGNI